MTSAEALVEAVDWPSKKRLADEMSDASGWPPITRHVLSERRQSRLDLPQVTTTMAGLAL
jgi:hypothetical protein